MRDDWGQVSFRSVLYLATATKMAFQEKSFQDIFRHSNVVERKRILARLLNYPHFNEEDDLRTAILLDVHYEMLSHLVNDGFLWRQIVSFFPIFERMLSEVKGKDLTDEERIKKILNCTTFSYNS